MTDEPSEPADERDREPSAPDGDGNDSADATADRNETMAETDADPVAPSESDATGTEVTYDRVEGDDSPSKPTESDDIPLSTLTDDLTGAATAEKAPEPDGAEFQGLFDEMDAEELDSDRLWAQLQADDDPAGDVNEREIRDVDKRRYCHQCVHFADPPTVRCEHDGTSILELVDVETVRVANCPVVLEEESIEDR